MKTKNKLLFGLFVTSLASKLFENLNKKDNVTPNTETTFNLRKDSPNIDPDAYVHHFASVIGSVHVDKGVFIGPFASIRGDEGLGIHISEFVNIQDGVVIRGRKNYEFGGEISTNTVFKENQPYSVYLGKNCILSPQSQIHGPVRIDANVFIGMQCFVYDSYVKENVVLEPGAKVMGVTVPRNRYVAAGKIIQTQEEADQLPFLQEESPFKGLMEESAKSGRELASGYKRDDR